MFESTRALSLFCLIAALGCENDPESPRIEVEPQRVEITAALGESVVRDVVVRNRGSVAVNLTSRLAEPDLGPFQIDQRAEALVPGSVTTVRIVFTPRALGESRGELLIEFGDQTASVEIVGTAVAQLVTVSPERIDFGNVVAGRTETRSVTLTNIASIDASIELGRSRLLALCPSADSEPYCLRVPRGQLDEGQRLFLGAGDSANLEVEFTPLGLGETSALLVLRPCSDPACATTLELSGVGLQSGLQCEPATLDFGQVNPGASRSLSIDCENATNIEVTVLTWALTPLSDDQLSVESPRPEVVAPGERISIEVSYAPLRLGDSEGVLQIETSAANDSRGNISIPLAGSGGGPSIAVTPQEMDFGLVSLIAPSRRQFVIVNTGFAPLTVSQIEVDIDGTGACSSPDAGSDVLQPGESQTVTIEFAPTVPGPTSCRIRIISNDTSSSEIVVVARGEGVNLPPCAFSSHPDPLDFGQVPSNRSYRRTFEIRNDGTDPCLLTATRIVPGTDPAFSLLSGDLRSLEIPAGTAELVDVAFAPQGSGARSGEVEFSISSQMSPFNTLELRGEGSDAGLIAVPSDLDFGTLGTGCNARRKTVSVFNPTSETMRIDSIELAAGTRGPSFALEGLPSNFPTTLTPGANLEFEVGFRSPGTSGYASAVVIEGTAGARPLRSLVGLRARSSLETTNTETLQQGGSAKIDVLFVVDKTGGMGTELNELRLNFPSFLQSATAQGLDYQIGVTTTDTTDEAGRLSSAPLSTTGRSTPNGPAQYRIIRSTTMPDPATVFASNVSFRESGGAAAAESGLRAAEQALSAPTITSHNAGFLRSDAALAVVFVSDEPDQSMNIVDYYENFLRSIKGFRNPGLLSVSAITAPTPPGRCNGPGGAATASGRYQSVAFRTGGSFHSICSTNWSGLMRDLGTRVFGVSTTRFFLLNPPVVSTLRVFVNGLEVPAATTNGTVNWTYDFATNSIGFAPAAAPGSSAKIRVEYTTECL